VRLDAAGQLLWARRFGGPGEDLGFAGDLAADGSGDVFVAGYSDPGFPTTPGALADGVNGGFVMRLSGSDGSVQWSTQLPGGRIRGMAADVDGTVLVGGVASLIFPATAGSFDETYNGGAQDAFAARVSSDGTTLLWGTFLGGDGDAASDPPEVVEGAFDVRRAPDGGVVLAGTTDSTAYPVTAGVVQPTYAGGPADGFVTVVAADGASLEWSTFLGGSDNDHYWRVAVDAAGDVYVGGQSNSSDYPVTPGAFDTTQNDVPPFTVVGDAVVSRLSSDGSTLRWATYVGGPRNDHVHGLEVAPDGTVVAACSTDSSGLPVTATSFDQDRNGSEDAYLFRLSADGSTLLYGSYLGGLDRTSAHALGVQPDGRILLAGTTRSPDFPTTSDAFDQTPNGEWDGWVLRMDWSPCPGSLVESGSGCASALGVDQVLDGLGCPTSGSTIWVSIRHYAPAGSTVFLFFGVGTDVLPVKPGCSLYIGPLLPSLVVVTLPPSGSAGAALLLSGTLPAGTPAGSFGMQALLLDPAAPSGVSGTQALHVVVGP
jgi:hypothetical protein